MTSFRCAKCRNTQAVVRKVSLAKGLLPDLLIRGGGKYRLVTCSLCGYTEIYDLSVYVSQKGAESSKEESAKLAPEA